MIEINGLSATPDSETECLSSPIFTNVLKNPRVTVHVPSVGQRIHLSTNVFPYNPDYRPHPSSQTSESD